MADICAIILSGRLKAPPTVRAVGGAQVALFTIAQTSRVRRGQDWEDVSTFWTCEVWGHDAAYVARGVAGTPVTVSGTIRRVAWTARDGRELQDVRIRADVVSLVLRPAQTSASGPSSPTHPAEAFGHTRPAPRRGGGSP